MSVRLNKFIADSGYCARRKADELIKAERVSVNGQTVSVLGSRINPKQDQVCIDGKPLSQPERHYLAFHKPVGVMTTRHDPQGRDTLYHYLPKSYHSMDPAGRLDYNTSGLLILSNDGDFIQHISHPRFHVEKIYEATLDKPLSSQDQKALESGLDLDGKTAKMSKVEPLKETLYRLHLITGLNRQIRRSFSQLGYRVKDLKRVQFGPVQLGSLAAGAFRPLYPNELEILFSPPPDQR